MKQRICLLLVGMAFIAVALCGGQPANKTSKEKPASSTPSLTGHWHSVKVDASVFYFIRDLHVVLKTNNHFFGSVTFDEGSTVSRKGTYKIEGDKILFTVSGDSKPTPVKFWFDKKALAVHEHSFDVSAHFARSPEQKKAVSKVL